MPSGRTISYVEMTFLRSLEQYGLDVDIRQAGIDFANSEYSTLAPMTQAAGICAGVSHRRIRHTRISNSRPNDIDYQIEADCWAHLARDAGLGHRVGREVPVGS